MPLKIRTTSILVCGPIGKRDKGTLLHRGSKHARICLRMTSKRSVLLGAFAGTSMRTST